MSLIPAEATDLSELNFLVGSKPACVQCDGTYRALDSRGIPYESKDMSLNENAELLKLSQSLGCMQAAVTFVYRRGIRIDHFSGFRPDKVAAYAALADGKGEAAAA